MIVVIIMAVILVVVMTIVVKITGGVDFFVFVYLWGRFFRVILWAHP